MADKRYYQKGNPEKEPLQNAVRQESSVVLDNGEKKSLRPSKYIKPEATKFPQALFVIYSGGTEREKDYFRLVDKNAAIFSFIKIRFIGNPDFEAGGKPAIMRIAIEQTKESQEAANEENPDRDKYFLLTDVDHFEQFLPEMKQECKDNGIELIISNSCFEVWLYYAEREDRCVGFEIPADKLEISSKFKTWANTKVKGGLKPTKAIFNIKQNIANAEKNYVEKNGLPTLFSTQMFRLARNMVPYIDDGLERLKNTNRQQRGKK